MMSASANASARRLGRAANDVFAVGIMAHLRYNGSEWSLMFGGGATGFYDVYGMAGNKVFAVGYYNSSMEYSGPAPVPRIIRLYLAEGISHCYDGSSWTLLPAIDKYLTGVWVSADGNNVLCRGLRGDHNFTAPARYRRLRAPVLGAAHHVQRSGNSLWQVYYLPVVSGSRRHGLYLYIRSSSGAVFFDQWWAMLPAGR